jgi:hypothetical protein
MKRIDDIQSKLNFYYSNPEEYNFLVGLLNDKTQLNDFLRPSMPSTLNRAQKKDRLLMMKIVYSLVKLTKQKEIMDISNSEELIGPRALKNGLRLFGFSAEVILAVLVAFLISVVVMIYMNIYFGLFLLPVLVYGAFVYSKQYVVDMMDKKVLELGNDLIKHDKNRYL